MRYKLLSNKSSGDEITRLNIYFCLPTGDVVVVVAVAVAVAIATPVVAVAVIATGQK